MTGSSTRCPVLPPGPTSGYGKLDPVILSSAALALLPTGPALDPAAATEEQR